LSYVEILDKYEGLTYEKIKALHAAFTRSINSALKRLDYNEEAGVFDNEHNLYVRRALDRKLNGMSDAFIDNNLDLLKQMGVRGQDIVKDFTGLSKLDMRKEIAESVNEAVGWIETANSDMRQAIFKKWNEGFFSTGKDKMLPADFKGWLQTELDYGKGLARTIARGTFLGRIDRQTTGRRMRRALMISSLKVRFLTELACLRNPPVMIRASIIMERYTNALNG
jgi:hypothetical protein